MAFRTEQNALSTTREVIFTVPATGNCSIDVKNIDTAITIYVGDETVTSANGFPLLPGESVGIDLTASEVVYAVAASGTPTVAVMKQGI